MLLRVYHSLTAGLGCVPVVDVRATLLCSGILITRSGSISGEPAHGSMGVLGGLCSPAR